MSDDFKVDRLREEELINLGPCAKCGKKLFEGAKGVMIPFYVVTVSTALTNPDAIRRRVGLEMQLGSSELARVMGTDEPLASVLPPTKFILYQDCALNEYGLMDFVEKTSDRIKEEAALRTPTKHMGEDHEPEAI